MAVHGNTQQGGGKTVAAARCQHGDVAARAACGAAPNGEAAPSIDGHHAAAPPAVCITVHGNTQQGGGCVATSAWCQHGDVAARAACGAAPNGEAAHSINSHNAAAVTVPAARCTTIHGNTQQGGGNTVPPAPCQHGHVAARAACGAAPNGEAAHSINSHHAGGTAFPATVLRLLAENTKLRSLQLDIDGFWLPPQLVETLSVKSTLKRLCIRQTANTEAYLATATVFRKANEAIVAVSELVFLEDFTTNWIHSSEDLVTLLKTLPNLQTLKLFEREKDGSAVVSDAKWPVSEAGEDSLLKAIKEYQPSAHFKHLQLCFDFKGTQRFEESVWNNLLEVSQSEGSRVDLKCQR